MLTLMSCLHLSSFNELSFTQTCLSQWYDICVHIRSIFLSFFCLEILFECFFVFKTLTRWSWSLLTKPASSSSKEQDSSPTYQVVLHILWQSCRPRSASHALCPPCFIKISCPPHHQNYILPTLLSTSSFNLSSSLDLSSKLLLPPAPCHMITWSSTWSSLPPSRGHRAWS